ncbi:hypothetical protein ABT354_33360 [Streptomyces sp. NPDC000594]|uniref:hypothetical protein n=1 Tax=Streptomyces sp. NPDC000594 TaxID=3154261 RepID=UPI003317669A
MVRVIDRRRGLARAREFNPLDFGPCRCPDAGCPLKRSGPVGALVRGEDTRPVLERIRAEIRADIDRRRRFGAWGRGEG